jgi:hypothetical protein
MIADETKTEALAATNQSPAPAQPATSPFLFLREARPEAPSRYVRVASSIELWQEPAVVNYLRHVNHWAASTHGTHVSSTHSCPHLTVQTITPSCGYSSKINGVAPVAQMDRVAASEAAGCGCFCIPIH